MTMLGATLITQRHPTLFAPSTRGEAGALVTRGGPHGQPHCSVSEYPVGGSGDGVSAEPWGALTGVAVSRRTPGWQES